MTIILIISLCSSEGVPPPDKNPLGAGLLVILKARRNGRTELSGLLLDSSLMGSSLDWALRTVGHEVGAGSQATDTTVVVQSLERVERQRRGAVQHAASHCNSNTLVQH